MRAFQFRMAVAAALMALLVGNVSVRAQSDAPADELEVRLNWFGLKFRVPEGWEMFGQGNDREFSAFLRFDDSMELQGRFTGTHIPFAGKTMKEFADHITTTVKGKVTDARAGNLDAKLIELPGDARFQHKRALVFELHDQLVLLDVMTRSPDVMEEMLTSLNATLEIYRPTAPSENLRLSTSPTDLFGSFVSIRLPESFRRIPTPGGNRQIQFTARDWNLGKDEASLVIVLLDNPDALSTEEFLERVGPGLKAQLKLAEALQFEKIEEYPQTYASNTFDTAEARQRLLYMVLDDRHMAAFIIAAAGNDAQVKDRYLQTLADIAESAWVSGDEDDETRRTTTTQPFRRPTSGPAKRQPTTR